MGSLTLALVKVILQSFRAQSLGTKYRTMKFAIAVCGVLATSAIAGPFAPMPAYRREASADAAPVAAPWNGYYGGRGYGHYPSYRREASADAAPVAAPWDGYGYGYGGYGYVGR